MREAPDPHPEIYNPQSNSSQSSESKWESSVSSTREALCDVLSADTPPSDSDSDSND